MYIEDGEAVLINSGADKETAREILRLLNEFEWQLKLIVNTQGFGNHIGGNAFLQAKTGCAIAATQDEASIIENPILEAALIYGGFPNKELRQKLDIQKASKVTDYLGEEGLVADTPLTFKFMPGRSLDNICVITPEKVIYVGESLMTETELALHPLGCLWDVRLQLQSLQTMKTLDVEACVTSHGDTVMEIGELISINEQRIKDNLGYLLGKCDEPCTTESLVRAYISDHHLSEGMDSEKYMRCTSSIKNHMAYLQEEGLVQVLFVKDSLCWRRN